MDHNLNNFRASAANDMDILQAMIHSNQNMQA